MRSATAPLDVLLPTAEHLEPDPADARLAELYRVSDDYTGAGTGPRSPGSRHVRASMISTVDGAAWGPDHLSGSINDEADWRVFRVLRTAADVVLVGAGTARIEGYTALERPRGVVGAPAAPLRLALVSRSGRVPTALADGPRPPLLLTGAAGARAAADVLAPQNLVVVPSAADPDEVDLRAGLDALARRGLGQVLCEGGPHLLDGMLRADLVDELCLTTSPCLVGAGPGRVVAPALGEPAPLGTGPTPPRQARLAHLLHAPGTGTLLARWDLRGTAS